MRAMRQRWVWSRQPQPEGRGGWYELERRGVRHGFVRRSGLVETETPRELWKCARPIYFPRALDQLGEYARDVRRTRTLMERIRAGADLGDFVFQRLAEDASFQPAGVSVDVGDAREIEKVHVDLLEPGAKPARDLYAKLSWVSQDERDASLRIRFSFGSERLLDWSRDLRRARAADALAEQVFPECAAITEQEELRAVLSEVLSREPRLSERIIYSNAPGGGAVFHHDAEVRQRGVVYAQLAGRTAWFALPVETLAHELAELASGPKLARFRGQPERVLDALQTELPAELDRLLNASARTTRRLAERGHLSVLGPGDVLVLPSHGPLEVAWHSVFALGDRPSLAHSYALFAERRTARAAN